jgi:outer membrane receptor protein involved in Fe transport
LEQEWGYDASVPSPVAPTRTQAADSGFNPRFNLSYSPNADLTTYLSASKGFRPGGANQLVSPPNIPPYCAPGYQPSFGSDSVWNYEIGEKARLFDNWLSVNSDFYYIKWTGVQQTILQLCGYQYQANAGNGRQLRLYGREIDATQRSVLDLSDTGRRASQRNSVLRYHQRLHGPHHECSQGHGESRADLLDQDNGEL